MKKKRKRQARVSINACLLNVDDAAKAVGLSRSSFLIYVRMGFFPEPVRMGRRVLWSVYELQDWVKAGCQKRGEEGSDE